MDDAAMMATKPSFADELKAWRAREGYTQAEAAAALEVKPRTYESWEGGRYEPEHTNLIRTAIQSFPRRRRRG